VVWFLNDVKLKSSKNRKVTYSSTSGEAKLLVMESDAEDMGEYRVEISNPGGQVTQTAMVTVICKYYLTFFCLSINKYSVLCNTLEHFQIDVLS